MCKNAIAFTCEQIRLVRRRNRATTADDDLHPSTAKRHLLTFARRANRLGVVMLSTSAWRVDCEQALIRNEMQVGIVLRRRADERHVRLIIQLAGRPCLCSLRRQISYIKERAGAFVHTLWRAACH